VFESLDVTAVQSMVNLDRIVSEQTLTGAQMLAVPFPSSNNLKNALRIMPGSSRTPRVESI